MKTCIPPPGPPIPIMLSSVDERCACEVSRSSLPEPDLRVRLDADRMRNEAAHLLRRCDERVRLHQWDARCALLDDLGSLLVELGPLARVGLVARATQELAHDVAGPRAAVREIRIGVRAVATRVAEPEGQAPGPRVREVCGGVLRPDGRDDPDLREVGCDALRNAFRLRVIGPPSGWVPQLRCESARDARVREQTLGARDVEAV